MVKTKLAKTKCAKFAKAKFAKAKDAKATFAKAKCATKLLKLHVSNLLDRVLLGLFAEVVAMVVVRMTARQRKAVLERVRRKMERLKKGVYRDMLRGHGRAGGTARKTKAGAAEWHRVLKRSRDWLGGATRRRFREGGGRRQMKVNWLVVWKEISYSQRG